MSVHSHLYRRDDPTTSKRAGLRASTWRTSHERKILNTLRRFPNGLTYRELAREAGMEPVAVGRRLKDMERRYWVRRQPRLVLIDSVHYVERDGMCVWWASR